MAPGRPRVILADDDVLLREGLARLLQEAEFDVVDQAGNGSALLALTRRLQPDLVIVDVRMPPNFGTEGLEAARTIRSELPETAVMILSAHVELEQATDVLSDGKRVGYLLKDRVANVDEFVYSLRRVLGGGAVVDPALIQELVAAKRATGPLAALSPREREVLALMAEGLTNGGIARRLWVTEGTVEKHVHGIFVKLPIPETEDDHRRVLAVIHFLQTR